jgi:hypothetical protein
MSTSDERSLKLLGVQNDGHGVRSTMGLQVTQSRGRPRAFVIEIVSPVIGR